MPSIRTRLTGGYGIEFQGEFFEGEPAEKIRANLAKAVRTLAEEGKAEVVRQIETRPYPNARAYQPKRRRTGFTAAHVEVYQDPKYEDSLYAKVRLEEQLVRPGAKATGQYKAENIPYIIAWVMESGRRFGFHTNTYKVDLWTGRHRSRRVWQHGQRLGGQKPIFAWRRTARMLRTRVPGLVADIAKGVGG